MVEGRIVEVNPKKRWGLYFFSVYNNVTPSGVWDAVGDRACGLDLKGGVILSLHLKVIQEMPLFLRDRQRSEFSFYQTSTASIKSVKIFKIDF